MQTVLLLCPVTLEINGGYGKHSQQEKHSTLLDAKPMLPGLWAHQLDLQPLSLLLEVSLSVLKASSDMVLLWNLGSGSCKNSRVLRKRYEKPHLRPLLHSSSGPCLWSLPELRCSYAWSLPEPTALQQCPVLHPADPDLALPPELPSCSLDLPCPHRLAWRSLDCHRPWLPSLGLPPLLPGVLPDLLGAATGSAASLAPAAPGSPALTAPWHGLLKQELFIKQLSSSRMT